MTIEEITITTLRSQLNLSRIDVKLLLFLERSSDLILFQIENDLSGNQVALSIERMTFAGYVQSGTLTFKGLDKAVMIQDLIDEMKIRQN